MPSLLRYSPITRYQMKRPITLVTVHVACKLNRCCSGAVYACHSFYWNMNQLRPYKLCKNNKKWHFSTETTFCVLHMQWRFHASKINIGRHDARIKGAVNKDKHDINYTLKFPKWHISVRLIFIMSEKNVTFYVSLVDLTIQCAAFLCLFYAQSKQNASILLFFFIFLINVFYRQNEFDFW